MTRLVLEIPQQNDLLLLLALLERLNIRIVQRSEENIVPSTAQAEEDKYLILKGLPARENLEDFIQEFEASRQDRPVPSREN